MSRYSGSITDQNGAPLPGALILVQVQGTGALAVLTDSIGASLINPIVANALGAFEFFVADGIYDLTYLYGGRVIRQTFNLGIGLVPSSDPTLIALIAAVVSGQVPFALPDEASGGTIPAAGSRLPYLSGGVLKIA